MGGDRITPSPPSLTPEDGSSLGDDFPYPSSPTTLFLRDNLNVKVENGAVPVNGENGLGFDEVGDQFSHLQADERRRQNVYKEILQSYDQLRIRSQNLKEAKSKIVGYTPGAWIEKVGGLKLSDYDVPKTTSLILIGPKGSGKSSLVNRISKVFEDDEFASERAQVSYNSSVEDGTYFLHEYMIPRGSTSFCLYDTRSLCDNDSSDNIKRIKDWIVNGVRHGKLVIRGSDSASLRVRMSCKARKNCFQSSEIRKVNFVIFVVDGLAVLKSINSDADSERQYTQMVAETFNCPYLSFKDDKPIVVVTHGDLLSLADRAHVRMYLGELLGVPPTTQIFDIPGSCDPVTDLTIVDMLRYSLEHADRNLPHKDWATDKVPKVSLRACSYLLIILGIAILSAYVQHVHVHRAPKSEPLIDWHAMRHLWLDLD